MNIKARDYFRYSSNRGLAWDMGLTWRPVQQMGLVVSVLDLGWIDWRSDVENFRMQGELEFKGIDLNDYFNDNDFPNPFETLLDSIKNIFEVEETSHRYRTQIPTKFFIGSSWDFDLKNQVALILRGDVLYGKLYPAYSLSYKFQPVEAFAVSTAWSVMHNSFWNLGAGMHANAGPVQFYLMADNIIGFFKPHTLKTANIHFGINLVFRYRNPKIFYDTIE
jgi:hypothetical protein